MCFDQIDELSLLFRCPNIPTFIRAVLFSPSELFFVCSRHLILRKLALDDQLFNSLILFFFITLPSSLTTFSYHLLSDYIFCLFFGSIKIVFLYSSYLPLQKFIQMRSLRSQYLCFCRLLYLEKTISIVGCLANRLILVDSCLKRSPQTK